MQQGQTESNGFDSHMEISYYGIKQDVCFW